MQREKSTIIRVLFEAKIVQQKLIVPPICFDLDPALQVDPAPQKLFAVRTGRAGDLFQHRTAFANDHALMALALAVDIYIDIHQICTGALLEALHHDRNAVRDLIPHIQQCLFTDDLRHQFLFRHIGVGIIVKVVRALHSILAQGIEQFLTVVVCPDAYGVDGIKHTQLLELSLAGFQISRLLDKIGLIDDCNGRAAAAAQSVHQNHFRLIQGTVWLKQHHGNIHIRNGITGSLIHALAQLEEVTGAHMQAQDDVDAAGPAAAQLHERRVALDNQISQLTREQRDVQRVADNAALELAKVKDSLSNAEVEDNMYASRLEQIDEQLEEVTASLESRRDRAEELDGALDQARQAQIDAREATEVARAALKDLRNRESEARNKLSEVRSELASQKKLDARMADSSPLVSRLMGAMGDDVSGRLGDVLEAPCELEGLVEQLLAGDIDALLFDDAATLERAGRVALDQKKASGEALLVARGVSGSAAAKGAAGSRLVDRLSVRSGYGPVVEALLGGYYVVDDLAAALAAPVVDGVTYVTPDGARVSCGGLVRVGLDAGEASGALERKRRIRELEGLEPDLAAVFEHVSDQVVEANAAVEEARAAEGDAAGEIARLEGERRSLLSEIGRLEQSANNAEVERVRISKRREQAAEAVRAARPRVDELTRSRDEARAQASDLGLQIAEANDELDRVRRDDSEAAGKLADAKVRLAQTSERLRSLKGRVPDLEHRLEGIDRRIRGTRQASRSLELLRLRVDPMHERYSALLERASDWAARLRDQASLEEADSASLKKTIEDAKAEVARAKERVDAATATQNEFKVSRGKLEVQVEAAIKAITADGTTVLEEALMLPAPTDRDAAERELNQLVRQINNLGPVNQVAMEEYEQLKRRADYIEEQLADLESARKALTKITVAIDRKMRKAFLVTFEKVDANFREIFAMLFPGGQAHLEMTDPEHPAETGIEVVAQPRGKRITKMMLMSGGEKSLTALALLFAVYRTRTVPFYVLDEVEAALDDANLSKLIGALDVLRSDTQLLVISHQRRTMEDADVLYGVSMQADGVSRVVSQKLDRETGKVVNA